MQVLTFYFATNAAALYVSVYRKKQKGVIVAHTCPDMV